MRGARDRVDEMKQPLYRGIGLRCSPFAGLWPQSLQLGWAGRLEP